MTFWFGVVVFALAIGASIMLHEAGHMVTAKRFGMKVTRYFVGFGPTLWSVRRGETEYGVKAIPAGGFVKIVGMTPLEDDVEPADQPRAFWRQKLWQRTVVLSAGSLTHFVIGVALLYAAAVFTGLPNPAYAAALNNPRGQPAVVGAVQPCLKPYPPPGGGAAATGCSPADPVSPARQAGLRPGDRIVSLGGQPVDSWGQLVAVTRRLPAGPTRITVVRAGRTVSSSVDLVAVRHVVGGTAAAPQVETTPMLGVSLQTPPLTVTYGPLAGLGQAAGYTGRLFTGTFAALASFPQKIPPLVDSLSGKARDPNGPISVVGATNLGGQALAGGGPEGPTVFLLLLASLNVFIGIFNLFPLLPLDGGHIAVAWFERARSWWAVHRGRPDPGRVDYAKLMPLTYAVIVVFGAISLLTIAADIVNPVRLFQ